MSKPFKFHVAYCEGHHDALNHWVADGSSPRAETELVERLQWLMIRRPRSEIWAETPPKNRQVLYLDVGPPARSDADDADEADHVPTTLERLTESSLWASLERTLHLKVDHVVDGVLEYLLMGEKAIVWVLTRESVEIVVNAIEKASSSRQVSARLRAVNCQLWATHGGADQKVRFELAREFREHSGAGVLVVTMDSMPDSISLFGATSEHYAQLHFLPGPMEQTENRPYLHGTAKLDIIYYVAKGTADERVATRVIPRLRAMDTVTSSQDASSLAASLTSHAREETKEEYLARLLRGDGEDVDMSSIAEDRDGDPFGEYTHD